MLARIYNDPWDIMREFRGGVERIFSDAGAGHTDTVTDWMPRVDVKEAQDAYEVVADLPGVIPQDIDISLEGSVLTITGTRASERNDAGKGYTRNERVHGSFCRRFTLPSAADVESISATTERGVLRLHIPKRAKALPKKIAVVE